MPRHETIEASLLDIFTSHKVFFEEMSRTSQMDAYKNAFLGLKEKGFDLKHLMECFESLRQASQEAIMAAAKYSKPEPTAEEKDDVIVGGETELREALNSIMSPKTIARATLYNYLEELGIRKTIYTLKDKNLVLAHIKGLKTSRKKS